MQLQELVLDGFKSFADKTQFLFRPGLTVIVGPNGCGKSNLVDAIRWVLGEQSAKTLRAGQMPDVIFAGTPGRKARGYAEVSLIFTNGDDDTSLPYQELHLTRRLFGSGESEYLINGESSRLKDIRDIFRDTGVGMEAYSIVEQGGVEWFLQANPRERRIILDEAAGISKYKAQRQEATRKLERVEGNLLRLADIVDEVRKQLRSIQYHAARARSFRQLSSFHRGLSGVLSLEKSRSLDTRLSSLRQELAELDNSSQRLQTILQEIQSQQADCSREITGAEDHIRDSEEESLEIRKRLLAAEERLRSRRRQVEELAGQVQKALLNLVTRVEKVSTLGADLGRQRLALGELKHRNHNLTAALSNLEEHFRQIDTHSAALQANQEKAEASLLELVSETSQSSNTLTSIRAGENASVAQIERTQERLSVVQSAIADGEAQRASLQEELSRLQQSADYLEQELGQRQSNQQVLEGLLTQLRVELQSHLQARTKVESRLAMLRELELSGEGLVSGVKQVLEEARRTGSTLTGVEGLVADYLTVQPKYAQAIAAALGEKAQMVVVRTQADAIGAINFLKERAAGRASFLARESLSPAEAARMALPAGALTWADQVVQVTEGKEPLRHHLLADTLLVEDLGAALRLPPEVRSAHKIVTLKSEVLDTDGRLVGGYAALGGGLVERKSELESLKAELAGQERRIAQCQMVLHEHQEKRRELEQVIRGLRARYDKVAVTLAQKQESLRHLEIQLSSQDSEKRALVSEFQDKDEDLRELKLKRQEVAQLLEELSTQRHLQEDAITQLRYKLQERAGVRQRIEQKLTTARLALARRTEKIVAQENALKLLQETCLHHRQELTTRKGELAGLRQEEVDSQVSTANLERLLVELRRENALAEEEHQKLLEARGNLRLRLRSLSQDYERARSQRDPLEERRNGLKLKASEVTLRHEQLASQFHDRHPLDLRALAPFYQPPQIEWSEVRSEADRLQGKLDRFGGVNLDTITEEEELLARASFLEKQQQDLIEARASLQRLIARTDSRIKKNFHRTFAQVRTHFQELFRKLFGGGHADIIFEDGADILEGGIDIVARPPGKEAARLSLFSGGEKVLIALAMLLAVIKTRPTPFCVLDEVDAALDDSNVSRFVEVIKDFLKQSQFILITHCKFTMSAADVLYGITMQEPGVSQKVEVEFEQAQALLE